MKKIFMENGNEIKAFDSIEGLKAHIEALKAENDWEDDIIDLHSGTLDGKRYYGIGSNEHRSKLMHLITSQAGGKAIGTKK